MYPSSSVLAGFNHNSLFFSRKYFSKKKYPPSFCAGPAITCFMCSRREAGNYITSDHTGHHLYTTVYVDRISKFCQLKGLPYVIAYCDLSMKLRKTEVNDEQLEARRANVKFIYIFTSICYISSAFFLLTLVVYLFLGMYVIYYQKLTLGLLLNSFVGYLTWGLVWQAGPNVELLGCKQLGKLDLDKSLLQMKINSCILC